MKTTSRPRGALLLLVPLLLALVACGASNDSVGAGSASADKDTTGSEPSLGQPDPGLVDDANKSSDGTASTADPLTRATISTGEISLHGPSVSRLRSDVLRLLTSWQGTVADEESSGDRRGRLTDSRLTLRVPSARFDDAMAALARVGIVDNQSRRSEDVTTQVLDNGARVRAAERSIRQIELLLSRATKIGDIIAIESELTRRQADLDSLKSQQTWLADQTSLSTINVYLSRTDRDRGGDDDGFVAGLSDGWDALKGSVVTLVTVVGAVLPFAVALALVGLPLWVVVRRRRRPAPPPADV